jgi:hypothetical protein
MEHTVWMLSCLNSNHVRHSLTYLAFAHLAISPSRVNRHVPERCYPMRIFEIVQTRSSAIIAITAAVLFSTVVLIWVGHTQFEFYQTQQKDLLWVQRRLLDQYPRSDVKVERIGTSSYRIFRIVEGIRREYYSIDKVGTNFVVSDVKAKARLHELLRSEAKTTIQKSASKIRIE